MDDYIRAFDVTDGVAENPLSVLSFPSLLPNSPAALPARMAIAFVRSAR